MHTSPPLVVLAGSNRTVVISAASHRRSVGVTPCTGFGNVGRIDGGLGAADGQHAMAAVAVNTGGDSFVRHGILALTAGLQTQPVSAFPVIRLLVHSGRRIVLLHVFET